MPFMGVFGPSEQMVELEVHKAYREDLPLIKEWIEYANKNKPEGMVASSLCNFLVWDIAIANSNYIEGDIFKVISQVKGRERLEGILYVRINEDNEVYIEALEVAPWNRESYLGDEREFRYLGLILIGQAILYGGQKESCGIIRLESLDVRREYYKGLEMEEPRYGRFVYNKNQAADFIEHLIELNLLQVKEV